MFEKKKSVLLFLLPGLCMLLIFYIIPFFSGIGYSLMDGSYKNEFVGLKNYREIWQNSMFLLGLKNTMELSLICAPLLWILSFLLASALASIKPFGGFFRSSVLLPYLTPSSAILLVWLVLFDYGGPVNRALAAMGAERVMWLSSGALRLPVVLMFLWKNLGFCLIIFLAALQSVPQPLYEYATLEGAGFMTRAFRITLPLVTPTAFLVFVLDQRVQDFQRGLFHRGRISGLLGLYAAKLYEQHVPEAQLSKRDCRGVFLWLDCVRHFRRAVLPAKACGARAELRRRT